MNEMIKKILQIDADALNSLDTFVQAATKAGYSQKEIDDALEQVDGFPLDDDDLDEITGGYSTTLKPFPNRSGMH